MTRPAPWAASADLLTDQVRVLGLDHPDTLTTHESTERSDLKSLVRCGPPLYRAA